MMLMNFVDDEPPSNGAKNLKDPPEVAAGPPVEQSVAMAVHHACVTLFGTGHDRL